MIASANVARWPVDEHEMSSRYVFLFRSENCFLTFYRATLITSMLSIDSTACCRRMRRPSYIRDILFGSFRNVGVAHWVADGHDLVLAFLIFFFSLVALQFARIRLVLTHLQRAEGLA